MVTNLSHVQLTERDMFALRWIGEQYAIRFDHLRTLLALSTPATTKMPNMLSPSATRHALERWQKLEFIEKPQKILAHQPQYILLSRRGISQLDIPYPYYDPRPVTLRHIDAVNSTRLALQTSRPQALWTSERAIRAKLPRNERDAKPPHIPDAEVTTQPTKSPLAIEVELTPKDATRLTSIIHGLLTSYSTVWYFLHPDVYTVMRETLQRMSQQARAHVLTYSLDMERIQL